MSEFQAYNAALVSGSAQPEAGDRLANAMKLIIIPLLTRSFQQQQRVVDDAYLTAVVKDLFDPAEEIQGGQTAVPTWNIHVTADLNHSFEPASIFARSTVDMFDEGGDDGIVAVQPSIQTQSTWSCCSWPRC